MHPIVCVAETPHRGAVRILFCVLWQSLIEKILPSSRSEAMPVVLRYGHDDAVADTYVMQQGKSP